jgi:branched-chain amino acid aminotransferase
LGRIVNLDGTLVPPEGALISVFDRGFLYGDSVYEVLRTYGGAPFKMGAHLARLSRSAQLIGLELAWTLARIESEVLRTITAAGNSESYVRIIATRGAGEIGLDPALARNGRMILIAKELVVPPPEVYQRGVKLALVGVRRNLREAIDPAAKTGNYLNNVLAIQQARQQGAFDALMLDSQGRITEATTANVFGIKAGELRTPALAVGILEGVTRGLVLALAKAAGIPVREADLTPDELLASDEVFITSTTRELVPVVAIIEGKAEHPIAKGVPGPITRKLHSAFRDAVRA